MNDVEAQQALDRAHEAACRAMREAPTAEGREAARLEALRLEEIMRGKRSNPFCEANSEHDVLAALVGLVALDGEQARLVALALGRAFVVGYEIGNDVGRGVGVAPELGEGLEDCAALATRANACGVASSRRGAPLLTADSPLDVWIAWLEWCDGNGVWSDEALSREGEPPMTVEGARDAVWIMLDS